jgi:SnoaL-like domain
MPWFPDFASALKLARGERRAEGQADPVGQYMAALTSADTRAWETVWPGEVVVCDPRDGMVRGRRHLRQFVRRSHDWLAERHARVEPVTSTVAGGRAVVELLAHLSSDGQDLGVAGSGRR